MIDSGNPSATGAATAAPDDTTLLDASRWALWQTLARGLAHSLANAAQLLMLDPPPTGLLAEARVRVSRAHALLAIASRTAEAAPSFLPHVLADVDALQRLQTGLPSAAFAVDVRDRLPMTAIPEADALHVLLLIVTRLKEACACGSLAIRVQARERAGVVHVTIETVETSGASPARRLRTPDANPLAASALLVTRAGGWLRESDAGWELGFPVMRRRGGAFRSSRG